MATNKEINTLIKQAEEQGWTVNLTGGGHYKWVSTLGAVVFTSQTPSDKRALANIKRDLRTRGFVELTKKKKRR
jgi:hypothetical protein